MSRFSAASKALCPFPQIVTVTERHHDGFFLVETSERKTGWVPTSAVRLAVVYRAFVQFADTQAEDELPLAENDTVYQLLEPEDDWAFGLVQSKGEHAWMQA